MTELIELPEYRGGPCINERCGGSTKQRVLSVEEVEYVYPIKDKFPWWPLPPGATHVCTVCGFVYKGSNPGQERQPAPPKQVDIDIEAWDWDPDDQFDATVREAVETFVRGAPADADVDTIAQAVGRYVVGVDDEFARDVMSEMDDFDGTAMPVERFM